MNEITLKDIYDIVDKRITGLEGKIEKYHDSFIKFEEGKLTQALQDIETLKGQAKTQEDLSKERKGWFQSIAEKLLFTVVGALLFLAGLVLQKLGVINLH